MKWKTIQWIAFFGLICGVGACWLNYAFIHSINAGVVSGVIFGSNATTEFIATYGSIRRPDSNLK